MDEVNTLNSKLTLPTNKLGRSIIARSTSSQANDHKKIENDKNKFCMKNFSQLLIQTPKPESSTGTKINQKMIIPNKCMQSIRTAGNLNCAKIKDQEWISPSELVRSAKVMYNMIDKKTLYYVF